VVTVEHVELRRGIYHDSVTLLQASRDLAGIDGIVAAQLVMATELNLGLLAGQGFAAPAGATANDLVVAVRGDESAVQAALAAVGDGLGLGVAAPSGGTGVAGEPVAAPRTVRRALAGADANLVLVSVPGRYALAEAMDALEAGRHVMVFSDNVPVEHELRLKREAARRGLLVMGPDCGTAIVGGVGLGFANVVRRGPVGIVAASGTGAQQLACLLDAAGIGVSHLLGVGGRDLTAAIGGLATVQALAALAEDPTTERIVLVSKPPAPEVAERIERLAATLPVPVHHALVGPGRPDLTTAAEAVIRAAGGTVPRWPSWPPAGAEAGAARGRALRGLYSGGTLAEEAMVVASAELGPIRSNVPLEPAMALPASLTGRGHLVIDFGDDALTRGRAHPMIDPSLRLDRIAAEAADPECGVLLLDAVLGRGADPDPAASLARALSAAKARAAADGRRLPVVVALVGTARDPQGLDRQAAALRAAGAAVFLSNAQAARHTVALLSGGPP
jgi:FdrA protein